MDVLDTALEVIDLRSFSNLWYWIMLAIAHWSAKVGPVGFLAGELLPELPALLPR